MSRYRSHQTLSPLASDHERLRRDVQRRLSRLSHLALALCLERVLKRLGYSNIRILGHWYLPGRSFITNADLSSRGVRPPIPVQMVVRIVRYSVPVPRSLVNDLYRSMLRSEAPESLLVTTSEFTDGAGQATLSLPGRAVKLLEGMQFADLLIQYGFGVRECRDILTGEVSTVLDELAFENLERIADALRSCDN